MLPLFLSPLISATDVHTLIETTSNDASVVSHKRLGGFILKTLCTAGFFLVLTLLTSSKSGDYRNPWITGDSAYKRIAWIDHPVGWDASRGEMETNHSEGFVADLLGLSSELKGMEKEVMDGVTEPVVSTAEESTALAVGDTHDKSVVDASDALAGNTFPQQPLTMEQLLFISSGNNPKKSHFNPNAEEFIPLGIANKNLASAMAFGQKIFGKSAGGTTTSGGVATPSSSGLPSTSSQMSSLASSSLSTPLVSPSGGTPLSSLPIGSALSTKATPMHRLAKSPAKTMRGEGISSPLPVSEAVSTTSSSSTTTHSPSHDEQPLSHTTEAVSPSHASLSFIEGGMKGVSSSSISDNVLLPSMLHRSMPTLGATSAPSTIPPPPHSDPSLSAVVTPTPMATSFISPVKGGRAPPSGTSTGLTTSTLPSSMIKPPQLFSVSPVTTGAAVLPPLPPTPLSGQSSPPPTLVSPSKAELASLSATLLKASNSSIPSGGPASSLSNSLSLSLSNFASMASGNDKSISHPMYPFHLNDAPVPAPLPSKIIHPLKALSSNPMLSEEGVNGKGNLPNPIGMRPPLKYGGMESPSPFTNPFTSPSPPGYASSPQLSLPPPKYEKVPQGLTAEKNLSMQLADPVNDEEGLSKYLEHFRETINPAGGGMKEDSSSQFMGNDTARLTQAIYQLIHRNKMTQRVPPPTGASSRAPHPPPPSSVSYGNERRQESPLRAPFDLPGTEFRASLPSMAVPSPSAAPFRARRGYPGGNVSTFSMANPGGPPPLSGGNRLSLSSGSSSSIPHSQEPISSHVSVVGGPTLASIPPSVITAVCSGPSTDAWEKLELTGPLKGPAEGFPVVECQGKLFALDNRPSSGGLAEIYIYENLDTTHRWSCVRNCHGHAPPANSNFDMLSHNGKLYVIGGRIKEGADFFTMWEFDTLEFTWTHHEIPANADLLLKRQDFAIATFGDAFYLFGGVYASQPQQWILLNDLWCLPLAEKRWHRLHPYSGSDLSSPSGGATEGSGEPPPGRAGHTAVAYEKSIYIFGGTTTARELDDLYEYNTSMHTWNRINAAGAVPAPRYGHSADVIDDRMILFGGFGDCHTFLNDIHELSFTKMAWTEVINKGKISPSPRFRHSTVALDGYLYLFGGKGNPKHLSNTYSRGNDASNGLEKAPKMAAFTDTFRICLNRDFDTEKDQHSSLAVCSTSETQSGSFTEEIVSFRIRKTDGSHKDIPLSESSAFAAQWAKFMDFNKTEREYVHKIARMESMLAKLCQEVATLTYTNKRLQRQTLNHENNMQALVRHHQATQVQIAETLAVSMLRQHYRSLVSKLKQNEVTIEELNRLCRDQQGSLDIKEKELQRLRESLRFDGSPLWSVHPSMNRSQGSTGAFSGGGHLPTGGSQPLRQGGEGFSSLSLAQSRPPGINGPPSWPAFFSPTGEGVAEAPRTLATSSGNTGDPSFLLPSEEGIGENGGGGAPPSSHSLSTQGATSEGHTISPSLADLSSSMAGCFLSADLPADGSTRSEGNSLITALSSNGGATMTLPGGGGALASSMDPSVASEGEFLPSSSLSGGNPSSSSYSFFGQSAPSSRGPTSTASLPIEGYLPQTLSSAQKMAMVTLLRQHLVDTNDPDIARKIRGILNSFYASSVPSSVFSSGGVASSAALPAPGATGVYTIEGESLPPSPSPADPFSSSNSAVPYHGYAGEMAVPPSSWDGNSGRDSNNLFGLMSALKSMNTVSFTPNPSPQDPYSSGNSPPSFRVPLGGQSNPGATPTTSPPFYNPPPHSTRPSSPTRFFPSTKMTSARPNVLPFLSTHAGGASSFLSNVGGAMVEGGTTSSMSSYGGKGGPSLHALGTAISPPPGGGLGPVGPPQSSGHSMIRNRNSGAVPAPPPPTTASSGRKEGFGGTTGGPSFFSSSQYVSPSSGSSPSRTGSSLPHELIKKTFAYALTGPAPAGRAMMESEGYRTKGLAFRNPPPSSHRELRSVGTRFSPLMKNGRRDTISQEAMMPLREKSPNSSESYPPPGNSIDRFSANHVFGGGNATSMRTVNGGASGGSSAGPLFEGSMAGMSQAISTVATATAGVTSTIPSSRADSMAHLLNLSLAGYHSTAGPSLSHATEASVAAALRGNAMVLPSGLTVASAGEPSRGHASTGPPQGFSFMSSDFSEENSMLASHSHHFGENHHSSSSTSLPSSSVDKTMPVEEIEWTILPDANVESDAELPTWV
ncbi:putative Tip elongation aberrant protein 1 [Cardiosporidium cionae]|uniref:Tip elongation aberrant protein 1 n=1 Tax=Cardiosporidium cionae TaxID=476202 RepID=A0ABQ7J9W3_9APIC|nr:putative Tip elongation aberrant protein 1 [Cardiosporidium cionae]|eukprot:KAF8820743.1 putative Tip elongation aberrant protein 1 [Cardiosporidium cionae]